jgi:hypothetical protein
MSAPDLTLITSLRIYDSEQYPGMFEIEAVGEDGQKYYLADTPSGRICLRQKSESTESGSVQAGRE